MSVCLWVLLLAVLGVACSLGQLSALYQGLLANAAGAADWLLGVGLTWASTCHVDLPQVRQAGNMNAHMILCAALGHACWTHATAVSGACV